MERLGVKISGHRGYFLTNDGVDLNQALINYGLDFLRTKGYKKIQAPFLMKREIMAQTAQLEEFDEALYKVGTINGITVHPVSSAERAHNRNLDGAEVRSDI